MSVQHDYVQCRYYSAPFIHALAQQHVTSLHCISRRRMPFCPPLSHHSLNGGATCLGG